MENLFTRLPFSHFAELIAIDDPPIGVLLCRQQDHALVECAPAGMNSRLFVSKYQLELPSKEDPRRFLEEKRREMKDLG